MTPHPAPDTAEALAEVLLGLSAGACVEAGLSPRWAETLTPILSRTLSGVLDAVKAEALREAADNFDVRWNRGHDNSVHPDSWILRDRAAALARPTGTE